MKLLLHIGTNKTGSSFLQSTFTLNNEVLLNSGVYLPKSKWDVPMSQGKITPGNGHKLANLLFKKDKDLVEGYLSQLHGEANVAGCSAVLLSNEILIRLFSDLEILQILEKAAEFSGFNTLNYLCYNRNVYEHALSLYKHRAKYGLHPNYISWFEEDYETLMIFEKIIENKRISKANWTFVLYEKDPTKILFELLEWLDIDSELKPFPRTVNASLSLRQIRHLNRLRPKYEYKIEDLYKAFVNLDGGKQDKAELKIEFFSAAEGYFLKYQKTINALSVLTKNSGEKISAKPEIKAAALPIEKAIKQEEEILKEFTEYRHLEILKKLAFKLNKIKKRISRTVRGIKKNDMTVFGGSLR